MMKNIDKIYNKIMESVSKHVKNVLNEGGGAGYEITIKGLSATYAVVDNYDQIDGKDVAYFTAELNPSEVEWKAEGYYEGVSSAGVYYDGEFVDEFPVEDRTIQGGNISGHVYIDDVEDYLKLDGKGSKQDIITYIEEHLKEFEISYMYGGGWIHVNLPNPIVFEPNPKRHEYPIEAESEYEYGPTFIDRIEIDAERVAGAINWFFENANDFDVIYGNKSVDESKKSKKGKKLNESFTLNDDLEQILRDFRTNIDMSRFYKVSLADDETYEPSLQQIIDTYDPYVEEVIGFISCPDSTYAEQYIKHVAQDNEWENGTEANMVVDFLYDLYDWCERHGLRKSVNESEENLSQSEKMDLWHEGKRDQNLKACAADKLRKNLAICKAKGYDAEASAIEAEIKSRGLKESVINEGEIANDLEAKYGKPFADLVAGVLAQKRDIDPEKDGDIMFDVLVPGEGSANNLGGELLRAAERIAYRYWNDGDKAGEGYGRETINPAVRFLNARVRRQEDCNLRALVDEIYDFVNRGYCSLVDNDYEKLTMNILRETILYIILKQAWNIPNDEDMWDFRNRNQDVDRDDEDEWDYDDRW